MTSLALEDLNFRWLLESAPDAMLITDPQGRVILMNGQVAQLFGYSREELLGQPIEMLMPERFRRSHVAHRDDYVRSPRTRPMGAGLPLYGQRKDGSEFPLEISLSALKSDGELLSLAAIRDITERRQVEQELEQHRHHLEELVKSRTEELSRSNERLKAEIVERQRVEENQARLLAEVAAANEELKNFAYVVSHDLKAPLRAIGSLANWISADYSDKFDDEGREQMALLISRVHRMDGLIDGILEYSRLGRIREEKVRVDLNQAAKEAIDLISPPPQFRIRLVHPLPTVLAERTRMVQVFQNLISNAVRYNDKPEGRVDVECRETAEGWEITVADNGPGIDPRHHEKIFQMFQTLAPRDRMESTGIGLTLVKRIVEMSGGRIWVESEHGHGAAFRFTLPRISQQGETDGTKQ